VWTINQSTEVLKRELHDTRMAIRKRILHPTAPPPQGRKEISASRIDAQAWGAEIPNYYRSDRRSSCVAPRACACMYARVLAGAQDQHILYCVPVCARYYLCPLQLRLQGSTVSSISLYCAAARCRCCPCLPYQLDLSHLSHSPAHPILCATSIDSIPCGCGHNDFLDVRLFPSVVLAVAPAVRP